MTYFVHTAGTIARATKKLAYELQYVNYN